MSKKIACCICGHRIKDRDSNNPRPVKFEGRCCDKCDRSVVVPARMKRSSAGLSPRGDQPYQWSERRKSQWIERLIREGIEKKPIVLRGGR
jgi:hypothetical protein